MRIRPLCLLGRRFTCSAMSRRDPIIFVIGCTGTGKSDLGVAIAKKYNGEIISADSMQIYKGLDIVTNKVTIEEMGGIPHHMMSFVDPTTSGYHVHQFREQSLAIIQNIRSRSRVPIIVGGTTYYVESILYTDNFIDSPRDGTVLNADLDHMSNDDMHKMLHEIDPESANLVHPNNRARVRRAIEVFRLTGKRKSEHIREQQLQTGGLTHGGRLRFKDSLVIALDASLEVLDRRLDLRVDKMKAAGLQSELEMFYDSHSPGISESAFGVMQCIGLKEFVPYLEIPPHMRHTIDAQRLYEQGVEEMKLHTRQYSRKQRNWVASRLIRRSGTRELPSLSKLDTSNTTNFLARGLGLVSEWLRGKDLSITPDHTAETVEQANGIIRCELCDMLISGHKNWQRHMEGKKHRSNIRANRKMILQSAEAAGMYTPTVGFSTSAEAAAASEVLLVPGDDEKRINNERQEMAAGDFYRRQSLQQNQQQGLLPAGSTTTLQQQNSHSNEMPPQQLIGGGGMARLPLHMSQTISADQPLSSILLQQNQNMNGSGAPRRRGRPPKYPPFNLQALGSNVQNRPPEVAQQPQQGGVPPQHQQQLGMTQGSPMAPPSGVKNQSNPRSQALNQNQMPPTPNQNQQQQLPQLPNQAIQQHNNQNQSNSQAQQTSSLGFRQGMIQQQQQENNNLRQQQGQMNATGSNRLGSAVNSGAGLQQNSRSGGAGGGGGPITQQSRSFSDSAGLPAAGGPLPLPADLPLSPRSQVNVLLQMQHHQDRRSQNQNASSQQNQDRQNVGGQLLVMNQNHVQTGIPGQSPQFSMQQSDPMDGLQRQIDANTRQNHQNLQQQQNNRQEDGSQRGQLDMLNQRFYPQDQQQRNPQMQQNEKDQSQNHMFHNDASQHQMLMMSSAATTVAANKLLFTTPGPLGLPAHTIGGFGSGPLAGTGLMGAGLPVPPVLSTPTQIPISTHRAGLAPTAGLSNHTSRNILPTSVTQPSSFPSSTMPMSEHERTAMMFLMGAQIGYSGVAGAAAAGAAVPTASLFNNPIMEPMGSMNMMFQPPSSSSVGQHQPQPAEKRQRFL